MKVARCPEYCLFTAILFVQLYKASELVEEPKSEVDEESQNEEDSCTIYDEDNCDKYVEDDINYNLNGLQQDDPKLIHELKTKYLHRPSQKKYQFQYPYDWKRLQGQFAQAYVVDNLYNKSKRNGFFFEAGAYNGEILSNTLWFELEYKWSGILVEANPKEFARLLKLNRKTWNLGKCLATKDTPEVVMFDAYNMFGGILQKGRIRPGDNIPENSMHLKPKLDKERKFIKMQCFPLYSILLAVGNPTVHYLSLDIEGAELKVLQTIPWDKVDIRVISLEICRKKFNPGLTEDFTDDHDEIVDLLKSKNYRIHRSHRHTEEELAFEVIFIRKDVKFPGLKKSKSDETPK